MESTVGNRNLLKNRHKKPEERPANPSSFHLTNA
jgi:hypothetical protein